jgi:hypothetical protein
LTCDEVADEYDTFAADDLKDDVDEYNEEGVGAGWSGSVGSGGVSITTSTGLVASTVSSASKAVLSNPGS